MHPLEERIIRIERIVRWIGAVVAAALLATAVSPVMATSLTDSYITPDGLELGLVFDQGIGLSGQAIFRLQADNRSIEILLTNTSTAIPDDPNFDNPSDQVLTSLYFDLGGPGLIAADPVINGGNAWVGADSIGVGNGNTLQAGDDISTLWGYGNFKYAAGFSFLPPNFVSTNTAHSTAFVAGDKLRGPDYGAISSANLLGGHDAGLRTISDTVRFVVNLDKDVTSLESIVAAGNYLPYIEFGSDFRFLVEDAPPTVIPEPLTVIGVFMGVAGLAGCLLRRKIV